MKIAINIFGPRGDGTELDWEEPWPESLAAPIAGDFLTMKCAFCEDYHDALVERRTFKIDADSEKELWIYATFESNLVWARCQKMRSALETGEDA